MSEFHELENQFGLDSQEPILGGEPIKNEGFSFYEHIPGAYTGLVGDLHANYVNKDKKKCQKDDPGAQLSSVYVRFLILQDPELKLINEQYKFISDVNDVGRFFYNQFLTLDPKRQWQNVQILNDFTCNENQAMNVIKGDKGSEDIYLNNIRFFKGVPITFEIETSEKGSRYIKKDSLKVLDHSLTPQKYKQREILVNSLNQQIEEVIEENRKKREANKPQAGDNPNSTESEAQNPNDFLRDFTGG